MDLFKKKTNATRSSRLKKKTLAGIYPAFKYLEMFNS